MHLNGPKLSDCGPLEMKSSTGESLIPFVSHWWRRTNATYKGEAYAACAVMCGRALEAICRLHSTKSSIMLGDGLQELLDMESSDRRLFQWGQELREYRNIGAHAAEGKVSRDDAQDLLIFAQAICEYIYVLGARYQGFVKRKQCKLK